MDGQEEQLIQAKEHYRLSVEERGDSWRKIQTFLTVAYLSENPPTLSDFTNLMDLCLHEVGFAQNCDFSKFAKLETLALHICGLIEVPETIFALVNLRKLSLYGNKLQEIPDEMRKMQKLAILDLSDNQFEEIPSCLIHFQMLRDLDLSINPLAGFTKMGHDDMEKLGHSYVSDCGEVIFKLGFHNDIAWMAINDEGWYLSNEVVRGLFALVSISSLRSLWISPTECEGPIEYELYMIFCDSAKKLLADYVKHNFDLEYFTMSPIATKTVIETLCYCAREKDIKYLNMLPNELLILLFEAMASEIAKTLC